MEAKINSIDYITLGYILTEWATLQQICQLMGLCGYVYMAIVCSRPLTNWSLVQSTELASKYGLQGIPIFPSKESTGMFHISTFITILSDRNGYYLCFTEEETEAQRADVTCPGSYC